MLAEVRKTWRHGTQFVESVQDAAKLTDSDSSRLERFFQIEMRSQDQLNMPAKRLNGQPSAYSRTMTVQSGASTRSRSSD